MSQTFVVQLRGASFANTDGTNRQVLLAQCRNDESLILRAEPNNPHDRHAVAVLNAHGLQLGYLPSDARDASAVLRGEGIKASVFKVVGGPRWWHRFFGIKRNYGLLIRLTKSPIDWKSHDEHRATAQKVDTLVKEAIAFEKSGGAPDETITRYLAALAAVIDLNRSNQKAAAHRYEQAPINRVTMLLVKRKQNSEAHLVYSQWRAIPDPVGITKADREAVAKRMAKLFATGAT